MAYSSTRTSGVGKTCLLLRYANDSFSPTFITTIGIDFKIKNIELDNKKVNLQMYDVTDRASFQSIRNWVGQIQQHADVHVNKILIGNKCDMTDDKVVSTEEGQALADEYGVKFFETSAKNNINVEGGFIEIAREVKNRLMEEGGPHKKDGVTLSPKPPQAKKGCC
jgi:Ras-related protein Rab-8A